jgi:hypothetical protein
MTLDISIDDFATQRQALIQQLAVQYNVHPSQITLAANAGSVQLIVTIATSNGTGTPVTLAQLQQSVNQVDNTALTNSISRAMGTAVTVQNTQTRISNVTVVSLTSSTATSATRSITLDSNFAGSTPRVTLQNRTVCLLSAHALVRALHEQAS